MVKRDISHLDNPTFKVLDGFPELINPPSANPPKWSNTLRQFVAKLSTNCLSVFGHFVGLMLKGLTRTEGTKSLLCNVPSILSFKTICKPERKK